jgi:hypothetical protein
MAPNELTADDEVTDNVVEFAMLDGEDELPDTQDEIQEYGFGNHAASNARMSRATSTVNDYQRRWLRYEEFVSNHFKKLVEQGGISVSEWCMTRYPITPSCLIAYICYECDLSTERNPVTKELMGCLGKSVTNYLVRLYNTT